MDYDKIGIDFFSSGSVNLQSVDSIWAKHNSCSKQVQYRQIKCAIYTGFIWSKNLFCYQSRLSFTQTKNPSSAIPGLRGGLIVKNKQQTNVMSAEFSPGLKILRIQKAG
jgi:hypothetical protein